jgi:hypothetical protein
METISRNHQNIETIEISKPSKYRNHRNLEAIEILKPSKSRNHRNIETIKISKPSKSRNHRNLETIEISTPSKSCFTGAEGSANPELALGPVRPGRSLAGNGTGKSDFNVF